MSDAKEEKDRIKQAAIDLLKKGNSFEQLRIEVRNALERELQIDQTIPNASTSSRLESYSQIDDNELATGFIIDFFKSLHLYSSLEIVEKELYGLPYYDRKTLGLLFNVDVHLDQPVLLQVVHTVREEDSQQEVFRQAIQSEQGNTTHPICPIASSVQMQDTRRVHESFNDRFDERDSNDIFAHMISS